MLTRKFRINLPLLFLLIQFSSPLYSQEPQTTPTPQSAPENSVISASSAPSATSAPPVASNTLRPVSTSSETKTPADDLIHFGDLIEIDVIGSVEYDWRGQINPEGFIAGLSLNTDQVFALCQDERSIAEKIVAAYGRLLRNPQITVRIVDRSERPIATLLGAVKTPQAFRIKRPVRLNELIVLSGGIIDTASGEVQIFRPARLSCGNEVSSAAADAERPRKVSDEGSVYIRLKLADLIAGKPEANPYVKTGDVVTVEEASSIYVIGGVNNPQTIFARQEMTVSRAIATAGGAVKGADTKKIVIYRRKNGETSLIDVDLTKIDAKQAEDVVLQPFDIIEVPHAGRESKRLPPQIGVGNARSLNGPMPVVIVD